MTSSSPALLKRKKAFHTRGQIHPGQAGRMSPTAWRIPLTSCSSDEGLSNNQNQRQAIRSLVLHNPRGKTSLVLNPSPFLRDPVEFLKFSCMGTDN